MSLVLERTTILPTDDKNLARAMFRELVHEQAKVLLVVLGTGKEAEATVQRADKLARSAPLRWVCWARKPLHVQEDVRELKDSGSLADELEATRVFATSFGDEVRDKISASEPVPSMTRLLLAYARAEVQA
jgi:K+-sensing histidine kinase KdpD